MKTALLAACVAVLLSTVSGFAYNCNSELQDCNKCPSVQGCSKTVKCGCCRICTKVLEEGDVCISLLSMISQSPAECAEGLLCNPVTKKCTSDHSFIRKLSSEKVYEHVVCKDNKCQCSFEGTILPEYSHLLSTEVTEKSCNCARAKAKFLKTNMVGQIFLCDTKGSYESMQCRGSECYCVNEDGKMLKTGSSFPIGSVSSNPC
ncbi:uncharacterized protein LOC115220918 [Argonauta hians]